MADEDLTPDGGVSGGDARPDDGDVHAHVQDAPGSDAGDDVSPESLASELGWCPKDEWRGDPADWKPAKTFLKETVKVNREQRRTLKNLEDRFDRMQRASETLLQKAREEEAAKWEAKFADAVDAGDTEAAKKASQKLAKIEAEVVDGPHPSVAEFADRNASWFQVDPIATEMAVNICERHKTLPPEQQLAKAEAEIRKRFPEYFTDAKPRTKGPAEVAEQHGRTARTTTSRGPKGFADLPADAKVIALKFEKQGVKREDFAKEYWKENA